MAIVDVTIKLDGKELAENEIRPSNIVLSQPMWDHHTFSIECLGLASRSAAAMLGENAALDSLRSRSLGAQLQLTIRDGDADSLAFTGVVTTVRAARVASGDYAVILEGTSPTILLDGPRRHRIWYDMSVGDVIKNVIGEYNLKSDAAASTPQKLSTIIQHDETDFEFVNRLCRQEGLWAWYDGDTFRVAADPSGPERELGLYGGSGRMLESFTLRLGTAPGYYNTRAWDPFGIKAIMANTRDVNVGESLHQYTEKSMKVSGDLFASIGDLVARPRPQDTSELDDRLKHIKQSWAGQLVIGEGDSYDLGLTVGGIAKLASIGTADDNGRYVVTSVTHLLDGEAGYRNSFLCMPEAGAAPPPAPERPAAPVVWGGVVKNVEDPDGQGRVKVQLHHSVAAGEDTMTGWLRVAQGHTGKSWGTFVMPELEDEVLVAAIDGDQNDLVVIGSVPKGTGPGDMGPLGVAEALVGAQDAAGGMAKVFLTKSGNRITVVDKSGSEVIEVSSPGQKNQLRLSLDGGAKIEMLSDGDVSVTAKGAINLTSDKDIIIDAKGKLELSSGADTNVKATGNAKIEGGMAAGLKGAMEATLEAGGKVACNPAGVEIKGALVRLN